jgi:hypothetical protein
MEEYPKGKKKSCFWSNHRKGGEFWRWGGSESWGATAEFHEVFIDHATSEKMVGPPSKEKSSISCAGRYSEIDPILEELREGWMEGGGERGAKVCWP